MQISVRRMDRATIIDVSGDIDLSTSPELRKVLLREVHDNGNPRVVLNLTGVGYIDSSGVASLVEGLKGSRDHGTRLILVGVSGPAREVLQLSRLLKVFEIYDTEVEALAA